MGKIIMAIGIILTIIGIAMFVIPALVLRQGVSIGTALFFGIGFFIFWIPLTIGVIILILNWRFG